MARQSPLRKLQEQAEAEFLIYGLPGPAWRAGPSSAPVDSGLGDEPARAPLEIVATYGEVEAEYAAIRKAAALLERPQRGTLMLTGADRLDFLNRMLTNELKGLGPGHTSANFWLNRKGRIDADLLLIELPEHGPEHGLPARAKGLGESLISHGLEAHAPGETFFDLDVTAAAHTVETLSNFVITEDVQIADESEKWHGLALHGPKAVEFLRSVCDDGAAGLLADLTPGRALTVEIQGYRVLVDRRDTTGEVGLELLCPVEGVKEIHEQILEAGLGKGLRSIGWLAYNIARIEHGTPLYLIDFGPDSLPHETGVLRERVSFTKGCYLGQEVVARIESLGHPSKVLTGLKIEGEAMPVTGAQVFAPGDGLGEIIGAVTSATPSPMLGRTIIAFAVLKHSKARPGEEVVVNAEGERARAVVHPLRFWPRES